MKVPSTVKLKHGVLANCEAWLISYNVHSGIAIVEIDDLTTVTTPIENVIEVIK